MRHTTLAVLAVAAAAFGGCDQPVMTRFECGTIKLEAGGRVQPARKEVASLPAPGTVYMMLDRPVQQVIIDARLVEVRDKALLDLGLWWPGGQKPLRPVSVKDTTPEAPPISVGFGFGTDIGGRRDRYEDRDRTGSVGTGVGLGFPLTSGRDGAVTSAQVTFEFAPTVTPLDKGYFTVTVQLGRQLDGTPIVQTLLLPMLTAPDAKAAAEHRSPGPTTYVTIRPDNTYVLGGLLREPDEVEQQVPLLQDLPLLNRLFRARDDRLDRRDLIVVITPRLVCLSGE